VALGARLDAALTGRRGARVAVGDAPPTPAAALLAEARRLQDALRAAGLGPGDRVVLALPAGPGFVSALVAATRAELTLAPIPVPTPGELAAPDAVAVALDARALLVADGAAGARLALRRADSPCTRDARFLLRTSGTSGAARWIACSERNVLAVLDSHAEPLAREGATVLAVLPWHHAFGLVIQLLPALLAGAALVCDARGGRDPDALLALAGAHGATHLDAVPLTLRRLASARRGARSSPRSPAASSAARRWTPRSRRCSRARASRSATDRPRPRRASSSARPARGAPRRSAGRWRHPLACDVRLGEDGELAFRGPNAALGEWWPGEGLVRHDPARWVRTGDLARREGDGTYTLEGRCADAFKLANGRYVGAGALERALCARFPTLAEAMLSTPDGERLLLACTPALGAAAAHGRRGAAAPRPARRAATRRGGRRGGRVDTHAQGRARSPVADRRSAGAARRRRLSTGRAPCTGRRRPRMLRSGGTPVAGAPVARFGPPHTRRPSCSSKSSPSATNSSSARRSTPTPRTSRASSPRSASRWHGGRRWATAPRPSLTPWATRSRAPAR
jgi:hypothetical protein